MAAIRHWHRALALASGVAFLTVGCSVPAGMNHDCEWPREQPVPLDLSDDDHTEHLLQDVKVAEELAVRYEDTRLARRLARDGQPRTRDECDAKLFKEVAALHAVDVEDLLNGRNRLNSRRPEVVVYLPLVLLYTCVSFVAARRLTTRFGWADEKVPALTAGALVSIGLAVALVWSGHLWGGAVEMVRMGNSHLTYRAHRLGWRELSPVVFVFGVAVFWIEMTVSWRLRRPESRAEEQDRRPPGRMLDG